jgi:tagatose-6-phosphate ketose/aldose isomerase
LCEQLSATASQFISSHISDISKIGRKEFNRAVFLGSGSRLAAARECALKMLEMTAGRVSTMCESYLGVRHGPMSFIHKDTLMVCFLSSDPTLRAYESDLMRELDQKELGLLKVVIGESIPAKILRKDDLGLECNGLRQIGDENAPVIDVIAGQLLAFFRCMAEGLRPDSPSEGNVINRVVQTFALHSPMS